MRTVAPAMRSSGFVTFSAGTVDTAEADAAKDYLDRVRAYVPVEVVAFFIFVNSLVLGTKLWAIIPAKGDDPASRMLTTDGYVALLALIIGAAATILFTYVSAKRAGQTAWRVQAAVTLIAFLVWTYALGARAFDVLGLAIVPSLAGLLLATFTLFSGFIVPVKTSAG